MLELERVSVHYGPVAAVRELSMEVAEGEVVALVGANGAGKSTTLNTIAGLLRPSGGELRLDGRRIAGEAPERLVRRGLALVPEGRRIFGSLTVEENLGLGLTSRDDNGDSKADIDDVLRLFPVLKERYRAPASLLSGGQQQQLAIGRAMLTRPRLLLLDEPSLGLDPQTVDRVFEALGELRSQGMTMLLVEQSAVRAIEFADRSYVLSTGRMVLSGTQEELLSDDRIAAVYLGDLREVP